MAEKIKKFFAKKKADAKFKLAGPGHKLTESTSSTTSKPSSKNKNYNPQRVEPSVATRQAAEAALARLNSQRKDTPFNTSLAAIQAQVRRELEAEKKNGDEVPSCQHKPVECDLEASPLLAVRGVYFRCPIISEEVLSKEEWRAKMKEFLYEQLEEERGLTACLMIHSLNYNKTKVTECVDIMCKYLENIINNPTETKYHKIRCSNNTLREKVLPIVGAMELLFAAGFRQETLDNNGVPEEFLVFNESNNVDGLTTLEFLRDAVKSEDRIELELDRNLQVLSPAQAAKRIELPKAFYALSPEDIKKEQQLRTEAMEKQMQLRTKAMREKEELREIRKYKFALIRIRFPDGLYLQGTFFVYEKFGDVLDFVQQNLEHDCPFVLSSPTGHKLEEKDKDSTLADLRLVPATILTFQWHPDILDEMAAAGNTYLKPEVMMLMQSL